MAERVEISQSRFAARKLVWLPIWVAICLGAGALAGAATASSVGGWYAELQRPSWAPPNWVFGPVWTLLYILMGCAAWLVQTSPRFRRPALVLFSIQLLLNFLWTVLFFGLQSPGLALLEIGILWVAIVATMLSFFPIHRGAAWLMAPYLAWVSFAALLNGAFWWLNRGGAGS